MLLTCSSCSSALHPCDHCSLWTVHCGGDNCALLCRTRLTGRAWCRLVTPPPRRVACLVRTAATPRRLHTSLLHRWLELLSRERAGQVELFWRDWLGRAVLQLWPGRTEAPERELSQGVVGSGWLQQLWLGSSVRGTAPRQPCDRCRGESGRAGDTELPPGRRTRHPDLEIDGELQCGETAGWVAGPGGGRAVESVDRVSSAAVAHPVHSQSDRDTAVFTVRLYLSSAARCLHFTLLAPHASRHT